MNNTKNDSARTETEVKNDANSVSFIWILLFILCMVVAATLFITAAVIWVGQLLDSVVYSCLIFGGAAIIIALAIYLFSVRRSEQVIHDYLDTIYETSRMAKSGCEQIRSWFSLIFE